MRIRSAVMCVAMIGLASASSAEAPPVPEYIPTCAAPQITAPIQAAGGLNVWARSAAVWNGKDYAVVWVDSADQALHFRRFFADGTPVGPGVVSSVLWSYHTDAPGLVWTGTEYGVAWVAWSGSYFQVFFARLSATGTLVGAEVKASFVGVPQTAHCFAPALAWSGSGYAVAWNDTRNSTYDIFATLLNADGTVANAGASHDLVVCNAVDDQKAPSIAWSSVSTRYIVAWQDIRTGTKWEIYDATLNSAGTVGSPTLQVSGTVGSYYPTLVNTGNGLGMAWQDSRDSNDEIYFARLSGTGYKVGSDVRLTTDNAGSYSPQIVWTGAEIGVFWYDNRTGDLDIWFQRVSAGGAAAGTNTQLTVSTFSAYPGAAFARYGYLATCANNGYGNFVQAWGCAGDTTPPSCPTNLFAYSVTGTSAIVSWGPSGDNESDLAYYQVYRNNAPLAKTSDTLYADSGLALSTTYNYMVQPVNAGQLQNYACGSSLYVKTNATLLLMVNKSTPNAALTWTDASMNNYNVFRGTSPQVMSQIGSTASMAFDDPNVLTDNVLYFYTVDDPGW